MGEPFGAVDHRDRLELGAAVEPGQLLRADPLDPRLPEPGRARRRGVEYRLERGDIGCPALVPGQPPDPRHHRRHHVEPGHLVLLDEPHRLQGVEPGHQDDVAAGPYRGGREGERAVVVERPGHQHLPVRPRAEQGRGRRRRLNRRGRCRHDQLGPPGAPAAGHGLQLGGHAGREAAGGQFRGHRLQHRPAAGLRLGHAGDQRRAGHVQEGDALGGRKPAGDGLRHRADGPRGEHGHHEVRRVGQADRDAGAVGHAAALKQPGEALDLAEEPGAGQRHRAAGKGRPVRSTFGTLPQSRQKGSPGHEPDHTSGPSRRPEPAPAAAESPCASRSDLAAARIVTGARSLTGQT